MPVLNEPAFWAGRRSWCPADGKNLNRSFPGDPDGSYAEVLAHELFETFMAGSDVLLDLHAGDLPESLEPFCLYEESPVEAAPASWPSPTARATWSGRARRRAPSAAAPARRPPTSACRRSSPSRRERHLDEASVAGTCTASTTSLGSLGMLPGARRGRRSPPRSSTTAGPGCARRSAASGGRPSPSATAVHAGDLLGVVLRPWGDDCTGSAPPTGCRCSSPAARRSWRTACCSAWRAAEPLPGGITSPTTVHGVQFSDAELTAAVEEADRLVPGPTPGRPPPERGRRYAPGRWLVAPANLVR